jgi:hypothetical protein
VKRQELHKIVGKKRVQKYSGLKELFSKKQALTER